MNRMSDNEIIRELYNVSDYFHDNFGDGDTQVIALDVLIAKLESKLDKKRGLDKV